MNADLWLVEIVLDTGQRYQSIDLWHPEAQAVGRDMRGRLRVVAVTLIRLGTGECVSRPSCNVLAGSRMVGGFRSRSERDALADALGPAA